VRLWRVSDGALLRTLTGGSEHVYAVAFSPDGTLLATSGESNLVTLWRVESQAAQNR
jgi:WD40 repeat protein